MHLVASLHLSHFNKRDLRKVISLFIIHERQFYSTVSSITPGRRQLITLILLTNIDHSVFGAIGNKWQSKTLFLAIFDLRSLIVIKTIFNCRLPVVSMSQVKRVKHHARYILSIESKHITYATAVPFTY